jgi:4-oxalocrotonate tautomerase
LSADLLALPHRRHLSLNRGRDGPARFNGDRLEMALVTIEIVKGVFTPEQKKRMIEKVTDAMVAVEGETMRRVTWVRLNEVEHWAVGGTLLTPEAVHTEMTRKAA